MTILPSLTDKWRGKKNGKRTYVGQVLMFNNGKRRVIAEVYGETLEECRQRKHAVTAALAAIEEVK